MIFVDTLRQGEGQGWLLPQEIFSLRTRRLGRPATLKVRWLIKPHPRTRTHPSFSPKGPSLVPKLIFSFPRGCQTVSQRLSPRCIPTSRVFLFLDIREYEKDFLIFAHLVGGKCLIVVFICISYKGVEHLLHPCFLFCEMPIHIFCSFFCSILCAFFIDLFSFFVI